MITEGYLARHYQGRRGGRAPALLDIAQDYALKIILDSGLFEMGLTFKGGTALRKYRVGSVGRFSTDLDFSADETGLGDLLFEILNGTELFDVNFSIEVVSPGYRGNIVIQTPLGSPNIGAKIEVTARRPWLPPDWLDPLSMPVHRGYEFQPVRLPVMDFEESLAEKLAAFRRRGLLRDLYDLALFYNRSFDEGLVRRLTYLKVFVDVVEDGLGKPPFDPVQDILHPGRPSDFLPEDIGFLTGDVDISLWLDRVRNRYRFLIDASKEDLRWASCNPKDAYEVRSIVENFRA
jgi:predicted nucleotidyltransferase component of viral defense system